MELAFFTLNVEQRKAISLAHIKTFELVSTGRIIPEIYAFALDRLVQEFALPPEAITFSYATTVDPCVAFRGFAILDVNPMALDFHSLCKNKIEATDPGSVASVVVYDSGKVGSVFVLLLFVLLTVFSFFHLSMLWQASGKLTG
jgi:hypothetical protein